MRRWYGQTDRVVELATGAALWYHAGMPGAPLRWVVVRDAAGRVEPKAFSDALAAVRMALWRAPGLSTSRAGPGTVEIPEAVLWQLTSTLAYTT